MQVAGLLDAQVGFTLFDAWLASVEGHRHGGQGQQGDPLIAAAFKAFDGYAKMAEISHDAMIAGTAAMLGYQMNSGNNGVASTKDIAPFLALNVMA